MEVWFVKYEDFPCWVSSREAFVSYWLGRMDLSPSWNYQDGAIIKVPKKFRSLTGGVVSFKKRVYSLEELRGD